MSGLFRDIDEDDITPPTQAKPDTSIVKVKIEPTCFDGITVDTEYVPSSAILMWAQGSIWNVDYYSQILGRSIEPKPLDLHLPPIEQQYRYLKKVPLKVTSALSFQQMDTQTNTMVTTGGGFTYPFLTPNIGDMFVADIGDGRAGLFTITRAERATILKDSVYNVEWIMVSEATMDKLENLAAKVEETYYFSQSSLEGGCGPFVTTEDAARIENYEDYLRELIRRYFTDFLSLEHSCLMVPDQQAKTYDHFVTKAMLRMISPLEDPRVRKVRELNVMAHPVMSQPSIWDAILSAEPVRLYGSTERAHLVTTANFKGSPLMQAIGYTGISKVVFPIDAPTDVDSQYDLEDRNRPVGIPFKPGRPRRPEPGEFKSQEERDLIFFKALPDDVEGIPIWKKPATIHPVVKDDYYVLSEAFYNRATTGQSKLELLVNQYLEHEALNKDQFDDLLSTVYDWDNLERFYYHPIVIALLKTHMR